MSTVSRDILEALKVWLKEREERDISATITLAKIEELENTF